MIQNIQSTYHKKKTIYTSKTKFNVYKYAMNKILGIAPNSQF